MTEETDVRTLAAVIAELLRVLRRPALMVGWFAALLLASWGAAEPVLYLIR